MQRNAFDIVCILFLWVYATTIAFIKAQESKALFQRPSRRQYHAAEQPLNSPAHFRGSPAFMPQDFFDDPPLVAITTEFQDTGVQQPNISSMW